MTGGRLPLTVVGGYLGAGKTTLINALLADPAGERIAVLVNDFGDIDIDARLMDSGDADVISLTNGCICCSLADGFAEALDRIRDLAGRIDRVVIEVSGVGDPRKVAQWGHVPGFTLDGVVVLVDAETVRERSRDRYVGETVLAQLAGADLVVVTRADLLDDTVTSEVERWLADMVAAPVLRAPVPTAVLFGPDPIGDDTLAVPEDHASTSHISMSRRFDAPVSRGSIDVWADARPGGVVRAKGIVRVDDRPDERTVLQVCGATTTVAVDGPWDGGESAVVAIALPGTSRAAIVKWLKLLR